MTINRKGVRSTTGNTQFLPVPKIWKYSMETRVIPVMHENYRSRHFLNTSWCLVTFVLVEAGSAVNWSITRKQGSMRSRWGTILEISTKKPKHYPHQKSAPTRCRSDQRWNKGDPSRQSRLSERRAKRLLTISFFSRVLVSISTAVENFSCPNQSHRLVLSST